LGRACIEDELRLRVFPNIPSRTSCANRITSSSRLHPMKLQLLSDLHIEVHPHLQIAPAPGADLLVLAGDIGSYQTGSSLTEPDFGLARFSPRRGWPTPVLVRPGQPRIRQRGFRRDPQPGCAKPATRWTSAGSNARPASSMACASSAPPSGPTSTRWSKGPTACPKHSRSVARPCALPTSICTRRPPFALERSSWRKR